jgi:hypothetical protein
MSDKPVEIAAQVLEILDKGWNYNNLEHTRAALKEVKEQHPGAHIYFDEHWVTRALTAEAKVRELEQDNAFLRAQVERLLTAKQSEP